MESFKERLKRKPCPIGLKSLCCKNCLLGPCIVTKKTTGACGANQDLIAARNLLRFIAGGAAAHAGHAYHLLSFLNKKYPKNYIKRKTPRYLYKTWDRLKILPKIRFEHFKDISEALHTSTFGTNASYEDVLKWAMRIGIIDGYYGLYLATELTDKKYGMPKIKQGFIDLGVIDKKKINIAVHGHEPMLAEALAKEAKRHHDINLIGVCCSGAHLLAKHGIPLAANVVFQEDVIATGAVDVLAFDVQCVMPSLANLAECYHTILISTNEIAKMPNALHLPIKNKKDAKKVAKQIIKIAKVNKIRHDIKIPKIKRKVVVGFTKKNINIKKIIRKLKEKKIKGVVGVVGCVNPRVKENWIDFYKELSKDYLILTTGCIAFKLGQENLLDGERFFHVGSCVNNARIAEIFRRIAKSLRKEITDLPFLISCPQPLSEKSIAIGFFFAALGVDVHFGYPFMIKENTNITKFLEKTLEKDFRSKIFLETSPKKLLSRIKKEGLSSEEVR